MAATGRAVWLQGSRISLWRRGGGGWGEEGVVFPGGGGGGGGLVDVRNGPTVVYKFVCHSVFTNLGQPSRSHSDML